MKVIIYILIVASLMTVPVFALAECNKSGTTVIFVNGMLTPTESQANDAIYTLKTKYELKGKNNDISFILGYNQSHIAQLGDFFDAVRQVYSGGYMDYDLTTILRQVHDNVKTQKILLVGHSQGTFYTNAAYDYLVANGVDRNSITIYNVGTPADVVAGGGGYLTSSTDKVISSVVAKLTAAFSARVPLPANITLPLSAQEQADLLGGHSFSGVYLAEAPDRIVGDIDKEISSLQDSGAPKDECYTQPAAGTAYVIEDAGYKLVDGSIAYLEANETPTSYFKTPQQLVDFGNSAFSGAYNAGADLIGSLYDLGSGLFGGSSSSDSTGNSTAASSSTNTGNASAQAPATSPAPDQDALDNTLEQLDALSPAGLAGAAGAGIPPVQASCSAVPNPGTINQQVTFTATATGGLSSNYSYSWSGDCVLTPSSPANANCFKTFTSAGNYAATVTVTPWPPGLVQVSGTATCPVVINTPPSPYFNLAVCYTGATGTQATQAKYGYLGRDLDPGNILRNTVTNGGIVPQNVPVGSSTTRVWSSNTYTMNANNYVWTVTIDGTTKTATIDTLNGHDASFYDSMRCPEPPPPPYFNLAVCYLGANGTQATQARYGYTASNLNPGTVSRNTVTNNGIVPQGVPAGTNTTRVWSSNVYQLNANNYVWTVSIDGTTKTSTMDTLNGHVASFYDTMRCPDVCGDGVCGSSETCSTCSSDCGTCGGGGGGGTTLSVSCLASPNPANTIQEVTFAATATGGVGSYSYSWTGDCTGSSIDCKKTFSSAGTYIANLSVTSGTESTTATCPVTVSTFIPDKLLITELQIQGVDANQDFIELYNPNNFDVYLDGYRLVKRAQTSLQDTTIKSWTGDATAKIPAKSYYLWASSTDALYPSLLNADAWTQQNISADNGIGLRYGPENTGQIIDAVGWGTFDNILYESSAFPQNPGQSQSLGRKLNGTVYQDTDHNPIDFELEIPTPKDPNINDNTPPVITLNGSPDITVTLGHDYTDAGATANDDIDGDITSKIVAVNPVNKNIKGNYPVSYNVSDSAGNAATEVIRMVHIVDPFAVSCSALPNPANAYDEVNFTPQVPVSFSTCTYSWTGDCTGTDKICVKPYHYSGDYTATFQAACDGQFSIAYGCTVGVLGSLPPTIISVNNPADISVPFGTPFSGLSLPATVTANLSDGSTADLPVTWSGAGYNGNISQAYNFTGTFNDPLPDSITNPDNYTANINVTVQPYLPHLMITEIQTAGATGTKDEFIELYNPTSDAIDLAGYALKKKTSSGTESNLVSPGAFTGTIYPWTYFLIVPQGNTYTGSETPDLTYSGASYSIADNNTVLLYDNTGSLVDKVGYGSAADYETAPTVNPLPGRSITRIYDYNSDIYQDTDNNLADFTTEIYPSPKQAPPQPLSVSCYPWPASAITNQNVMFVSQVSGGITSNYIYSWTGDCTGGSDTCNKSFPAAGTYITKLTATSGTESGSYSCSVDVIPPLPQASIKDVTGCADPDTCTSPNYSSAMGSSSANDSAGISYYLPEIEWGSPDPDIVSYHVQYKRNGGAWQDWFLSTTQVSAVFGDSMVPKALYDMYDDEVYSFQVSAKNSSGVDGLWYQVDVDLRNPVVINEVAPFGTGAGSDGWLELYNKSDTGVDLTGWKIKGGNGSDTLVINLSGTIAAKTYLLIDKSSYFPASAIPTSGYLYLQTDTRRRTDSFYMPATGWEASDFQKNGQYYSLERVSPYGRGDDKNNWILSTSAGYGTPANENTNYQLYTPISTDFLYGGDMPVSRDGINLSPYLLQGFVTVYKNKTLTIEPGAVLKFIVSESTTTPSGLLVWGNLQAHGTAGSPIVFTSVHDDEYGGDIDQDAGSFAAQPGFWNGIKFTQDSSGSQLENVIVRYAGDFRGFNFDFGAAIKVDKSAISLSNSIIEKNENNGLYLVNSDSTVDSVSVLDNNTPSGTAKGIDIEDGSPTISNSNFQRNYYGIFASLVQGSPIIQNCTFGQSPDNNAFDTQPASLLGP